jgi:hypothetical protein
VPKKKVKLKKKQKITLPLKRKTEKTTDPKQKQAEQL